MKYLFPFLGIMGVIMLCLSGCEEDKTISLNPAEWECNETYTEYHQGYTTTVMIGKTMTPIFHPSSESTECAGYRLKDSILSSRAKKETIPK